MVYRKILDAMSAYVPGRSIEEVKKAYGLNEVVKLASNENPYGCSPAVAGAVMATLKEAQLYPNGYCPELRKAVGDFYGIPQNKLVFGAGTDEVIAMLGKILINPGDECITAEYTFSQYAAAVDSMDGKTVYVPMKDHGFDLDAILDAVTEKTKIVFIANPNNPTGSWHTAAQQDAFLKKLPSSVVAVFDEAYQEYVTADDYPDTLRDLEKYKNAVLLKTFSKVYGLASLRAGFGAMSSEMVGQIEKIRCPFNVTSQAQAAAAAAMADQNFVEESRRSNEANRKYLTDAIERMGFYVIPSQGNFVMADFKRSSKELFVLLMTKGYIIRPGAPFGMDTFLRITVGTKPQIDGFLEALAEVLTN
ncbi:MAG: histidinol-phosphate transaminase [Defluviitaleaceae bacterium]|nr:histidinol-phosphate transaminase [Defluviitaleaceae bacterium]